MPIDAAPSHRYPTASATVALLLLAAGCAAPETPPTQAPVTAADAVAEAHAGDDAQPGTADPGDAAAPARADGATADAEPLVVADGSAGATDSTQPKDSAQPPPDASSQPELASADLPVDAPKPQPDAGSRDAGNASADIAPDAAAWDVAAADVFVPAPLPTIDPEPAPACAKAKASADYFQFLDNLCDEKQLPKVADPEFACPVVDSTATATLPGGGKANWLPPTAPVTYGDLGLQAKLPAGLLISVVSIRRVNGTPHYRYLSNGTAETPVQPWSTTKFLAAANAAVALRVASNYKVGLTAQVGATWVGDLVTSLVNYDAAPYASNSLGAWFHDVGGRAKANAMIGAGWLKRPAAETFGGNYGSAAPAALGYSFKEAGGAAVVLAADKATGFANNLSMHTLAEALKRLVVHRESADERLPGIQWPDVRTLLYGAPGSAKYGAWGGLSADTGIYLQAGHDIAYLDARAKGQWRVFSKLGLGTKGQFVHVGYACFPVLDPQGKPVANWGREFVIAAHLASGGANWAERDRLLAKAYRVIVPRLIEDSL